MKTVSGVVVRKWTYKGTQPMNGKYMFLDFPFKRPILYRIQLEEGCAADVSSSYYHSLRVGDSATIDCMEGRDYVLIAAFVLVILTVIIGGIMLLG